MTLLPQEHFVYLGDTARLPYGTKGRGTIERYVEQNIAFLAKQNVKAVIVACNTASTVLTPEKAHGMPVFGMIEPGSEAALKASAGLRIGLLATRATVQSGAYEREIRKREPRATLVARAAPLLVPLVEEGWTEDAITNLIVFRYISPLLQEKIDTLILGCTHYPALLEPIRRAVGPHVKIVDPGPCLVENLRTQCRLSGPDRTQQASPVEHRFFVTDGAPHFIEIASRLLLPYGMPSPQTVDLTC
jgi:glutamate racemase